jgi:hypothetical protein
MNDKYTRGALSIIIEFVRQPRMDFHKRRDGDATRGGRKRIAFDPFLDCSIRSNNLESRVGRLAQDGCDLDVFIRVVQLAELVQIPPSPTDEGFRSRDGVLHPLAGCFYSLAGGFEVNPSIVCGKLEVAILRAMIDPDQFPHGMVEGGAQIVNSIGYYRGEVARKFLRETNADGQQSGPSVGLDAESVWFRGDESGELPFDIGNVVVGPLDFLFGAGKHHV